jgi:hypothetical protein
MKLSPRQIAGQGWAVPEEEKLERAMVAGLMLEVVLEAPGWPENSQGRQRLIKSRLMDSLVSHLAGRITLDRFRHLVHRLDHWFPLYYPLLPPPAPERQTCPGEEQGPFIPADETPTLVNHKTLPEWLKTVGSRILPQRPQRKIQPERLEEFLRGTRGGWFRVKDLAQDFAIDRKTAWEYLQKLQEAGLLVHNGGRSAAVRYRLGDRFLKVKLSALEREVAQALAGEPKAVGEQVAAWLAATLGEPFWEENWPERLAQGRRGEISAALKAAAVLEVVCRSGRQELLRLGRQWLNENIDSKN